MMEAVKMKDQQYQPIWDMIKEGVLKESTMLWLKIPIRFLHIEMNTPKLLKTN